MDTHPQVDYALMNTLEADKAYQQSHNEPKDPPLKFCGKDCRESYREDRIIGKTIPPVSFNGQMVSHRYMCAELRICGACMSKLEK